MLTTDIFTQPTSCLLPTYTISPAGNDVVSQLTAIRGYKSECWPFTSAETGFPTISAIACPLQYRFLAQHERTEDGTTLGTCCPYSAHIVARTAPDLCTRYEGYTSATVVDATATSIVHNNFFVDPAMVVSWTAGEMPERTMAPTSSSRTLTSARPIGTATVPAAPFPNLDVDPDRIRTTATTIAVAVGCAIGAVVLIAIVLGLMILRRYRKRQAQIEQQKAQAGHDQVANDMPPIYQARQSAESLPMYEAENVSRSSLAKA